MSLYYFIESSKNIWTIPVQQLTNPFQKTSVSSSVSHQTDSESSISCISTMSALLIGLVTFHIPKISPKERRREGENEEDDGDGGHHGKNISSFLNHRESGNEGILHESDNNSTVMFVDVVFTATLSKALRYTYLELQYQPVPDEFKKRNFFPVCWKASNILGTSLTRPEISMLEQHRTLGLCEHHLHHISSSSKMEQFFKKEQNSWDLHLDAAYFAIGAFGILSLLDGMNASAYSGYLRSQALLVLRGACLGGEVHVARKIIEKFGLMSEVESRVTNPMADYQHGDIPDETYAMGFAVRHHHSKVVKLLIESGGWKLFCPRSEKMMMNAWQEEEGDGGARMDSKHNYGSGGWTYLMSAAHDGDVDTVRQLLQAKGTSAWINAGSLLGEHRLRKGETSGTALMFSLAYPNVVRLLRNAGADPTLKDNSNGWTALHMACNGGEAFIETVQLLLFPSSSHSFRSASSLPCSPEQEKEKGKEGKSPSSLQSMFVNAQTNDGLTSLMIACAVGSCNIVDMLLKNGADAEIRDGYGDDCKKHVCIRVANDHVSGGVFDLKYKKIMELLEEGGRKKSP